MWHHFGETILPENGERRQLLKVKGEIQTETCLKESSDCLWGRQDCSHSAALNKRRIYWLFIRTRKHLDKISPLSLKLHKHEHMQSNPLSHMNIFTFLLVPHSQHPEYKSTEGGSKEAPPVVPHCKKGWRDFNAEQHTCNAKHTVRFPHTMNNCINPRKVLKCYNCVSWGNSTTLHNCMQMCIFMLYSHNFRAISAWKKKKTNLNGCFKLF